MIQTPPAQPIPNVSSASVCPLVVTVIHWLMIQMAFVLQMKFARTVHANPPFPQDVNVTQQLMIQTLHAQLTLSVSSASVCPRVVIVILMLQIQTASVHLE